MLTGWLTQDILDRTFSLSKPFFGLTKYKNFLLPTRGSVVGGVWGEGSQYGWAKKPFQIKLAQKPTN